jgi:hypothetical protein
VISAYNYFIIFLFILVTSPFLEKVPTKALYIWPVIWIGISLYTKNYYSLFYITFFYFIIITIKVILDRIFDIIDTTFIKLIDIKQWMIVTKEWIETIKKELDLDILESPLQGLDVYNLIEAIKERSKEKVDLKIHKPFTIWLVMYLWYLITIWYIFYVS